MGGKVSGIGELRKVKVCGWSVCLNIVRGEVDRWWVRRGWRKVCVDRWVGTETAVDRREVDVGLYRCVEVADGYDCIVENSEAYAFKLNPVLGLLLRLH